MPGKVYGSGSGAAVDFVTSGSYQRDITNYGDPGNVTQGTELEMTELAAAIVCTEDAMFSWIRYWWWLAAIDEPTNFEWFIIKCQSTDALQNVSDETVLENLQREGRILARGFVVQPPLTAAAPRLLKCEFYKLKLVRGEELRCVVNSYMTNTAGHNKASALLEWRQVGV